MRTGAGGPVGQSGSAPVRRTVPGTISAAGASTSKGNAPNSIGGAPERGAASAAGTKKLACTAVRSVSLNDQPERSKLSQPVLEPTDRDRCSKHGETAALDERQLEPARDHRAGEVTMADEHHVA